MFDLKHIKLRQSVAEFALNGNDDFKVRCFQIQTPIFVVNSDVFRDETDFSLVQRVGCSFACLEGGITVACLRHTQSTEYALAAFYADLC